MQFTILVTHDFLEMLCKSLSDVIMNLHVGDPSESHLPHSSCDFVSGPLYGMLCMKLFVRGGDSVNERMKV